jgi:stearoyl-CoA desaturase (delta-9 desaturase)
LAAIVWLGIIHVGAIAAFWTFSWSGLVLVLVLHWITGGIGVCLGYHRLFTHQSFNTYRPVRWLIGLTGCLSGEGDPIGWVAAHRKHHALSDQPGDPHSPHDGAWWSHLLWLGWTHKAESQERYLQKWAPDLLKDRGLRLRSRGFLLWNILFGALVFGAGYLVGGTALALSWLCWGVFLRLVLVLHSTWLVNSASHMWGYRNYQTTDDSRNLWWVALITYGEGWHNNHHAFPRMAAHGHRWWEIDVTYATICLMQYLGLAWNVVHRQRGSARA